MKERIQVIYDWLIPAHLEPGSNEYTRGVILVTVLLANIFFCLASYAWILFGMDLHGLTLYIAEGVITFVLLVYFATVVTLRRRRSLAWAANVMMLAVLPTVLFGITRTGGVSLSPIAPLLLTTALMGFVIGGLRIGVAWTVAAFIGYFTLFFLETSNILPAAQLLDDTGKRDFRLAIPLVATILGVAAIMVYEFLNGRLRTVLNSKRHQFAFQAQHDMLTELPNRDSFYHSVQLNIDAADLSDKKLALVYLDLDGFKPINDTHGHHAGDVVLQVIARRLRTVIRGSDTVARLGGDEFGLLFCGYESRESLERVLRKILEILAEDIPIGKTRVAVSGSLGVVIYPDDAMTFERLCRQADMAMYQAKRKKNSWCFHLDVAAGR